MRSGLHASIVEIAGAFCRSELQSVILFGSRAHGFVRADSDLDVLVLVEAPPQTWTVGNNLALRQSLDHGFRALEIRTDCWVRTMDQFSVARHVVGGVEHWAHSGGVVLYERAMQRTPHSVRTPHEIKLINVMDWIRGARRQLAHAVQLASGHHGLTSAGSRHRAPQHYATRSIQRAIGSIFILHGVEPPPKSADIHEIIRRLNALEPSLSARCREHLLKSLVTLETARMAIELVAQRLSAVPELRSAMESIFADVTRLAPPSAEDSASR